MWNGPSSGGSTRVRNVWVFGIVVVFEPFPFEELPAIFAIYKMKCGVIFWEEIPTMSIP